MGEDTGRISVSKDYLRAELGDLELRLVERLATNADVDAIRQDVDSLKRWRAYQAGGSAVAIGLGTTALGIAVAFLT